MSITNVDAVSFQMGFDAASEQMKDLQQKVIQLEADLLASQASEDRLREAISEYIPAIRQDEREQCAKVCEVNGALHTGQDCADFIRARGV